MGLSAWFAEVAPLLLSPLQLALDTGFPDAVAVETVLRKGWAARQQLVDANRGLVVHLALKLRNHGVDLPVGFCGAATPHARVAVGATLLAGPGHECFQGRRHPHTGSYLPSACYKHPLSLWFRGSLPWLSH